MSMDAANQASKFNQIQEEKLNRIHNSGNNELLETFEKKYKPIENKSWYEKQALLDEYINYLDTNTLPKKGFFSFLGMGGKKSRKFRKFRKSRKSRKSKKSRKTRRRRM